MRPAPKRINAGAAAVAVAVGALLGGVAVGNGATGGDREPIEGTPRVVVETAAGARSEPAPQRNRARGKRGPRGRTGPPGERGVTGPRGIPGSSDEHVLDIGIDWNGTANAAGHDAAAVELPGIGTLALRCPSSPPDDPSVRRLVLTPAGGGRRTVANLTTFAGAGTTAATNQRYQTDDATPLAVPIPSNGMISGSFSVEPNSGEGTEPGQLPVADITLSSFWKVNDPIASENSCHVSAQLLAKGS